MKLSNALPYAGLPETCIQVEFCRAVQTAKPFPKIAKLDICGEPHDVFCSVRDIVSSVNAVSTEKSDAQDAVQRLAAAAHRIVPCSVLVNFREPKKNV